jgi:hypothetical protein
MGPPHQRIGLANRVIRRALADESHPTRTVPLDRSRSLAAKALMAPMFPRNIPKRINRFSKFHSPWGRVVVTIQLS